MKGIDPKYIVWLGLAVTIEQAIGHGTVSLTNVVPVAWAPYVTSWCNLLAFIGTSIMTYQAAVSGPQTGPLLPNPTVFTPTVVKVLLVAFALSFLVAGNPAQAQIRKPAMTGNLVEDIKTDFKKENGVPLTGNADKDMMAIWNKIVTASNTDLTYASALAGAANTASSKIRKQCWDAIISLNQQANGAALKNADGSPMVKPDPSLFSNAESFAEVVDNLSPQGPLFTACAGAAQLAKTNTLTLINAIVTGAAGIAALPAGIIP